VDRSIRENRQDDWRNNAFKIRRVRFAIKAALGNDDELTAKTLELVKNQNEY
jgi:type I restriction enzyme R subunit